jgi:RNA polymerase sigma factor (sigma-70 family)
VETALTIRRVGPAASDDAVADSGHVTLDESTDEALVRAVARGDPDALAVLYQRHGAALMAYVNGLTDDSGLAEEVVQDTLVAVWRGAGRFRGDSAVRTWLFAIARRQAGGHHRRRTDLMGVLGDEVLAQRASSSPGPDALVLARAQMAAVQNAVSCLSAVHREMLHLMFIEGLSLREIALVTEVPLGTVKSRLSHARRALAAVLAQMEER